MEAAIRGLAGLDFLLAASAQGAAMVASTSGSASARSPARRTSARTRGAKLVNDHRSAKTSPVLRTRPSAANPAPPAAEGAVPNTPDPVARRRLKFTACQSVKLVLQVYCAVQKFRLIFVVQRIYVARW